jgi:hypothetical protein
MTYRTLDPCNTHIDNRNSIGLSISPSQTVVHKKHLSLV